MKWFCKFETVPDVGLAISIGEQLYRLAAVEPYVTKHGRASSVLVWDTVCPDCKEPFQAKSGLKCKYINRRCEKDKSPLKRVVPHVKKKDIRILALNKKRNKTRMLIARKLLENAEKIRKANEEK